MNEWVEINGDNVPKDEIVDFWVVRSDRTVMDCYIPMCAYLYDPSGGRGKGGWFSLGDNGETEVCNANFFRVVAGPRLHEQEVCRQRHMAKECDVKNDHKLAYSNCHDRELDRLQVLKDLENAGFNVSMVRDGIADLDGRWEIALRSMKWRNKGKTKWYQAKSPRNLFRKLKEGK